MAEQYIGKLVMSNGEDFFLDGNVTVGRSSSSELLLDDKQVSRHHACFYIHQGQYWIRDEGSANGTYINGVRLPPKTPQPLQGNEEIRFGKTNIIARFQLVPRSQYRPQPRRKPKKKKSDALPTTMLPVDAEKDQLLIGRDPRCDISVNHPQVSRQHARILRRGRDFIIEDLGSANGTFVGKERVMPGKPRRLQEGMEIRVGPNKLIFRPDNIEVEKWGGGVRLDALHLHKWVSPKVNLLKDISLCIQPREFVVLVGVSGAGKSTTLDALNGFRPATKGAVLINGERLYDNFDAYRTMIGYVPQDDIIHRELTVQEALEYAAELRLPNDTSPQERTKRVLEVISQMSLSERKDVPVKMLSGGQRKRVSIGVELLSKPTLLFLDEPTSGLDPGTETKMMRQMRELADEGHTILMITHATQNVKLCDKVVFLASGGYLAFFGKPEEAMDYFQVREFAEIYDKLEPPEHYSRNEKEKFGQKWGDRFKSSPYFHHNIVQPLQSLRDTGGKQRDRHAPQAGAAVAKTSWFKQFITLTRRYLDITLRDRGNIAVLLAQAPLIGLFIDIVFGRNIFNGMRLDWADPNKAIIVLFLLATISIWFGTNNAAKEIVKESAIYKRERMVNLKIGAYLASKIVIQFLLCLLQTFMVMVIVILYIKMPADRSVVLYLQMFLTLIFTAIAAMMMGLFISAVVKSTDMAISLVPILLIPQIIFAGALIPLKDMNLPSKALAFVTLDKWSFEGMARAADMNRLFRDIREEGMMINAECRAAQAQGQPCKYADEYYDAEETERSKAEWANRLLPQAIQLLDDQGAVFNVHYLTEDGEDMCKDTLRCSGQHDEDPDLCCHFTEDEDDEYKLWLNAPLDENGIEIRYEDWDDKSEEGTIEREDVDDEAVVVEKRVWFSLLKSWAWLWGYTIVFGAGAYIAQKSKDKRE